MRRVVSLVLVLALTIACGGEAKPATSPTPSPTAASGPRVVFPSGAIYRVELARTPEEQQRGLMFRENLPERSGMLFLFDDNSPHRFWMKNTMIPLDIVWLDDVGRVLFVSANTPPCKADPCPDYGPREAAWNVLEIAGGMAEKERVIVGSTLRFEGIK